MPEYGLFWPGTGGAIAAHAKRSCAFWDIGDIQKTQEPFVLGSSQSIYFWGIGVDNETALKQVSLMINEPSLTQLGSQRLTAVGRVPVGCD